MDAIWHAVPLKRELTTVRERTYYCKFEARFSLLGVSRGNYEFESIRQALVIVGTEAKF